MAISSYIDEFALDTGVVTTTQARSGYGHQPKLLIGFGNSTTDASDTAGADSVRFSFGMSTGATERGCGFIAYQDGDASANSYSGTYTSAFSGSLTLPGGPTIAGLWDTSSIDADGHTIVVDDQSTAGFILKVLSLGGEGIEDAEVGTFDASTSTGDQNVTSVSFKPDAVIFVMNRPTFNPDTQVNDACISIGAAAGASTIINACASVYSEDGSEPSDESSYSRIGECLSTASADQGVDRRGFVSAWLSNGFTISWAEVNAFDHPVIYLAIKSAPGHAFRIIQGTTATDTNPFTVNAVDVAPSAGLLFSCCRAKNSSNIATADGQLSVGAFSGVASQTSIGWFMEDNQSTTNSTMFTDFDSIYANINGSGTLDGEMAITGITGSIIEFTMSNADPSAAFFWALVCGESMTEYAAPIFF